MMTETKITEADREDAKRILEKYGNRPIPRPKTKRHWQDIMRQQDKEKVE